MRNLGKRDRSDDVISKTDIAKLSGIETGAQVNTVSSVAGKTGAVTLAKGDVGLGNVTNDAQVKASDVESVVSGTSGKIPDSAAVETELEKYLPLTGGSMSGDVNMNSHNLLDAAIVRLAALLAMDENSGILVKHKFKMDGNKIEGVGTPTIGTDAANKSYVDAFLKIADVLDVLTSSATDKALSANMGRILAMRVDAANGSGGFITPYDFGTDTPAQEDLTDYAMTTIFGASASTHDPSEIFNGTKVQNLNDKRVWQLANTPDTDPVVFEWMEALIVSEAQRSFVENPVETSEINDAAVTLDKLATAVRTLLSYVDTGGSIQALLNSKQASLNRTLGGNDNATGTVTDTGGNLSVPVPVTVTAPAASDTQTTAGTKTLRGAIQTIINNIAKLFSDKVDKVTGKGLSANDFTNEDKSKLDDINLDLKVDRTSGALRIYGTDESGLAKIYKISDSATADTVAYRDTGGAISVATPASDAHAATKKYVDDSVKDKVDSVSGKGLSTNDFDNTYKAKIDFIGSQTVTSLASLAVTKQVVNISTSANQTLSIASVAVQDAAFVIVVNATAAITVTLPTTTGYVNM